MASKRGDFNTINEILEARFKKIKPNVKRAMFRSTTLVQRKMIENIDGGSRSGRSYKRGTKIHTASAPGEFPKTDRGELVRSITTNIEDKNTVVVGQIIASADHAQALEFGTTKMKKRPFMQRTLDQQTRRVHKIFQEEGYLT